MAVCRWSEHSDVYVYYSVFGGITCCHCGLNEHGDFNVETEVDMLTHLRQHKNNGDKVPESAFERLEEETKGP